MAWSAWSQGDPCYFLFILFIKRWHLAASKCRTNITNLGWVVESFVFFLLAHQHQPFRCFSFWIPSANQTWLAAKSLINRSLSIGKSLIFVIHFPANHVWLPAGTKDRPWYQMGLSTSDKAVKTLFPEMILFFLASPSHRSKSSKPGKDFMFGWINP